MPNMMTALPNIGGALCSTPQFGWRSLLECRALTLPRRKTRWNLLGCPKLPNRSLPLEGLSSPYCEDVWGRYCCLTSFFFWLSTRALVAKIQPNKVVQWCPDSKFLMIFGSCISSEPCAAHFRPAFQICTTDTPLLFIIIIKCIYKAHFRGCHKCAKNSSYTLNNVFSFWT